jgi:hypothetical protein
MALFHIKVRALMEATVSTPVFAESAEEAMAYLRANSEWHSDVAISDEVEKGLRIEPLEVIQVESPQECDPLEKVEGCWYDEERYGYGWQLSLSDAFFWDRMQAVFWAYKNGDVDDIEAEGAMYNEFCALREASASEFAALQGERNG